MKMLLASVLLCFGFVFGFVFGFGASAHKSGAKFNEDVQFVQSMKVVGFVDAIKSVKRMLDNNCTSGAAGILDDELDQNMMFLAEQVKFFPEGKLVNELSVSNPNLLAVVTHYDVNWGKTYVIPECVGDR